MVMVRAVKLSGRILGQRGLYGKRPMEMREETVDSFLCDSGILTDIIILHNDGM